MRMERRITPGATATPVTIRAEGAALIGLLIRPEGAAQEAVVLHGATAVPMGYYRAFADWLAAERQAAVLLYDYRDFGASARGSLRQSRATMADWGLRDQAAALETLGALLPGLPRHVIGHSLGGLMLGHHPAMQGVERATLVASGPVHVSDHPFAFRQKARVFWHALPPLVRAVGYLPGRRLGFGADLPAGVYADWRRWCLTRGSHLADTGTRLPLPNPARVTARMRLVAVADDAWVPPAAVWRLMAFYPEATKRQRLLVPADFGLARIGHLGAFHRTSAALWPALIDP
jgi:predicted alpha/beta hydrolase